MRHCGKVPDCGNASLWQENSAPGIPLCHIATMLHCHTVAIGSRTRRKEEEEEEEKEEEEEAEAEAEAEEEEKGIIKRSAI